VKLRSLARARRWKRAGGRHPDAEEQWFWDHYEGAANQIIEFVGSAGLTLEGRTVADVGCGDGIMAMGVVDHAAPARLVGFDVNPVDVAKLHESARRYRGTAELPAALAFEVSAPTRLPASDASFDVVYTWSAFEHVAEPPALLRDIRRILKPDGVLFLQLWPFYYSALGSHLWDWFPEHFHHLGQTDDQITLAMRRSARHTSEWTEYMLGEFLKLNRVRVDELQGAVVEAGFGIRKVQLIAEQVNVPPGAASTYPLSDLGVSGVKLLAVPVDPDVETRAASRLRSRAPTAGDPRAPVEHELRGSSPRPLTPRSPLP
jgi:SAM-dependent methyltransferase